MMNVLCIDGPARGEIRTVKSAHSIEVRTEGKGLSFYTVHHFVILNRVIRVASVYEKIDDILLDTAFDLITSDLARKVVIN
jgi:hypothetical protein